MGTVVKGRIARGMACLSGVGGVTLAFCVGHDKGTSVLGCGEGKELLGRSILDGATEDGATKGGVPSTRVAPATTASPLLLSRGRGVGGLDVGLGLGLGLGLADSVGVGPESGGETVEMTAGTATMLGLVLGAVSWTAVPRSGNIASKSERPPWSTGVGRSAWGTG